MITFKSFFKNKHFDIIQDETKIRINTLGYYSYIKADENHWWVGNKLFILKDDPLTKKFFDKEKMYFSGPINCYEFIAVKNYFDKKNPHIKEMIRSNFLIEERNSNKLEKIINLVNENKIKTKSENKLRMNPDVNMMLPKNITIPLKVHKYIFEILKPEYASLNDELYYFNNENKIIAIVAVNKHIGENF